MAVVFACGWELAAPLAHYTNSGWTATGTPDPREGVVFAQHPDGYGGGERSLALPSSAAWLEATQVFSAPSTCCLNTMVRGSGVYVADGTLLKLLDDNGDTVAEVKALDAGTTSRLALLHAGTTIGTTAARLAADQWHRLAVTFQDVASVAHCKLYMDGQLRVSGTAALTTLATVTGLRWAGATSTTMYHDHTVLYNTLPEAQDATWVQGLRPNADDINGAWTPNPGGSTWSRVVDANDALEMQTSVASVFSVNLDNRSAVDAAWLAPDVRAVQVWCNGHGDGALDDGQAQLNLGASVTTGTTMSMNAGGSLAWAVAPDKPGGVGWAATDLDNISTGYSAA